MMITNLNFFFGNLLWRNHISRKKVCEAFDIAPSNLSRMLHRSLPTQQFVDIMDALGYDLKLVAVPKGENADE